MHPYLQITIGFARSGVLGYGGGPSVIPLIEYEAVKNYNWMDRDEFGETLALANTLPGPIATKMAAYVGYKVKGISGAVIAVFAHILPSLFALIALLSFFYSFRSSPFINGMIQGVTPVIAIMLLTMALNFLKKASKGLGVKGALGGAVICLVFIELFNIHPGIVVFIFLSVSFLFAMYKNRKIKESLKVTEKIKKKVQ